MAATYDAIGEGYDGTRRADPRLVERLIGHLAPVPGGRYLDLACGTGNYTAALAARGLDMTGIDTSDVMLAAARAKAPGIAWSKGRAEDLPYADGSFDGVMCSFAIHHFGDVGAAFAEVARVLGRGRLVILTATPAQMAGYWLNWYFPEAIVRSAADMPTLDAIRGDLTAAGFARIASDPFEVPEDLTDLFLYAGKHRPALYLDPAVRAGISTFARGLSPPDELERGLAALAADIETGAIDATVASYAHDKGDYLFVIAEL